MKEGGRREDREMAGSVVAVRDRGGEPKEGENPDGRGPAGSEGEKWGGGSGPVVVFGPEEEMGRGERAGRWAKREGKRFER
jgi:hypothetical protein